MALTALCIGTAGASEIDFMVGGTAGGSASGVAPDGYTNDCGYSFGASSLIEHDGTFITIGEVDYYPLIQVQQYQETYRWSAQLVFTTKTSGTLVFDYARAGTPMNVSQPTPPTIEFSNFTQTLTSQPRTLKVTFNLTNEGCTVPFIGTYH